MQKDNASLYLSLPDLPPRLSVRPVVFRPLITQSLALSLEIVFGYCLMKRRGGQLQHPPRAIKFQVSTYKNKLEVQQIPCLNLLSE